jgi:hypothetical protein
MRHNSDPIAPHSAITGIVESYKVSKICSGAPHSGITILAAVEWLISECDVRNHCYITAENRLISGATFRCHTINFHVVLFNH